MSQHDCPSFMVAMEPPKTGKRSSVKDEPSRALRIQKLFGEATAEAVADLHRKGISTWSSKDGKLIETKPSGDQCLP